MFVSEYRSVLSQGKFEFLTAQAGKDVDGQPEFSGESQAGALA